MNSHVHSGFAGFAAGAVLTVSLGLGIPQPGQSQPTSLPTDPVHRDVTLISRGLFRADSKLPSDPSQSLEQHLDEQVEAIDRLSSRLAMLDSGRLDAIERRIASFERSLNGLDVGDIRDLGNRFDNLDRSVQSVSRAIDRIPQPDLTSLQRTLDDLRRAFGQLGAGSSDNQYREIQSTLRSIESQLRSIERQLR